MSLQSESRDGYEYINREDIPMTTGDRRRQKGGGRGGGGCRRFGPNPSYRSYEIMNKWN